MNGIHWLRCSIQSWLRVDLKMGLLRPVINWIICHSVALIFAGFIAIAIVFRGPLFGIETEIITPESAQPQSLQPQSGEPAGGEPESFKPVAEQPASITKQDKIQPPKENTVKTLPTDPQPQTVVEPQAVIEPLSPEVIANKQGATFRPDTSDIEQVSVAVDEQLDLIQKARKAYWNDQLQQARDYYQQYIQRFPENPDGYGELGNLLSTLGELDLAASHYQKAAELMKKQGREEQAEKLYQVLESIRIIQTSGK